MTNPDNGAATPVEFEAPQVSSPSRASAKKGLPPRATLAILVVALFFVLMPFFFWQASWFGRPLNDQQLTSYLSDTAHPRNAQHGLVQLSERIERHDPSASRWYPQVVALAHSPETQLRLTAAWVMGRDNTSAEFHKSLLGMLSDSNPMVCANAALALVRFADAAGRPQIRALLEPQAIVAPKAGKLLERLKVSDVVRPGTLVAHIAAPQNISSGPAEKGTSETVEVRSAVPGSVERWLVSDGTPVVQNQPILEVSPSPEVAWEALRALYLIGQVDDLPSVERFTLPVPGMPPGIAQQAKLTAQAIRSRSGS